MDVLALRRSLVLGVAALLAAGAARPDDRPEAMLVLSDDGALDGPAARAIRSVAAGQLARHGIRVSTDRRTEGVFPPDESLAVLADEIGARRIFTVRIGGRLGEKVPLTVEEVDPRSLTPVQSASLTARGLEECDIVTARLVDAVVDRRPADRSATMTTVTADESRPFRKRPWERFWFVTLPLALYNARSGTNPVGFAVGYGYEAESFRLGATLGGYTRASQGVGYVALEVAWIPLSGEISPYLGGGIGYMAANDRGGMGALAEAGLEFFRLHGVRAMVGGQLAIPFFSAAPSATAPRDVFPAVFGRIAF